LTHRQLNRVLRSVHAGVDESRSNALPDSELLNRFATSHDEGAFGILVMRHQPMVLGVCRRILNHSEDAEDACQATFLALARSARSVRQRDSLASWLYGVARRIALKSRLAAARTAARGGVVPARVQTDPVDDLTWREVLAVLDDELDRLSAQYRAPLVLCYLEGKTHDEAARQLGWTLGSLRGRLERGREKLGERLHRRGVSLPAVLFGLTLGSNASPASAVSMAKTAILFATGKTRSVPANLAALAQHGTKIMVSARTKLIAMLVLKAGLLLATTQFGAGPTGQAVTLAAPAPKSKDAIYFTIGKGDTSVYEIQTNSKSTGEFTDVVTKVEVKDGALHVTIDRDCPGAEPYVTTITVSDKGLFRVALNGKTLDKPTPLLKMPAKIGANWKLESGATYTIIKEEEIEVPAGKFKSVRVETVESGGTVTRWFAPNVGVVKITNDGNPHGQIVLKELRRGK
jgi:RNA polymerase sigma factor (sigma-70 family)